VNAARPSLATLSSRHTMPDPSQPSAPQERIRVHLVETCSACGQRYLPTAHNRGLRCGDCLARQFEAELALELMRATAAMPPRRPSSGGA